MPKIDTCEHWKDYRIPNEAAICPGCGRRHPVRVPPTPAAVTAVLAATGAIPRPAAASQGPDGPTAPGARRRPGPLLRTARGTRWLLTLTAWVATAFGLAAAARYVVGLDELADDLDADVPGRVGDVAHGLGLATAIGFALAIAAAATWSRRAHHNLAALELTGARTRAWSLGGWLVPGPRAKADKRAVDALWRDTSPSVAGLPGRGFSRRPVSRVVLHWWTLWLAVPAAGLLAASLTGGVDELHDDRALFGLAAAALLVSATRALYDVVGLVTVAQAHRAAAVLRDRAATLPWSEDDEGWDDDGTDTAEDPLQPLRR